MSILTSKNGQDLIRCCNDLGVEWQLQHNVLYISEDLNNDAWVLDVTSTMLTNIPVETLLKWVITNQEKSLADTVIE